MSQQVQKDTQRSLWENLVSSINNNTEHIKTVEKIDMISGKLCLHSQPVLKTNSKLVTDPEQEA